VDPEHTVRVRAKDARFEAPMGWSVGRGCPLPTEEGVWGGGCGEGAVPPPQKLKKNFLVQCVQQIFTFRPSGGGGLRPVALTLIVTECVLIHTTQYK